MQRKGQFSNFKSNQLIFLPTSWQETPVTFSAQLSECHKDQVSSFPNSQGEFLFQAATVGIGTERCVHTPIH